MTGSYLFILSAIFIVGCYVGRWLQRAVERFPHHLPLKDQLTSVFTEGDCRNCSTGQSGVQHVPVFGGLLAGRCRGCGRKSDGRRPIVELATGLILAWLYHAEIPHFGASVATDSGLWSNGRPPGPEVITELWSPLVWLHLRYLLHAVMVCGLIVATVIDFELFIIPDGCTVPVMIFAPLFAFAVGQTHIVPVWFQDDSVARWQRSVLPDAYQWVIPAWDAAAFSAAHPHWHGLLVSVSGMIAGAAAVWCIRVIGFWVLRQEAMGDGDVVLMGMIGAVVGWQPVLSALFMSFFLGLFATLWTWIIRRRAFISYGPWLSTASVVLLLMWPSLWPYFKVYFDQGLALFVVGAVMLVLLAASLYFVQLIKRVLGIGQAETGLEDEWTSADHLSYYGCERPDEQTGLWRRPQWPGCRSGRGLHQYEGWRKE